MAGVDGTVCDVAEVLVQRCQCDGLLGMMAKSGGGRQVVVAALEALLVGCCFHVVGLEHRCVCIRTQHVQHITAFWC
jgi:hypothetical protein